MSFSRGRTALRRREYVRDVRDVPCKLILHTWDVDFPLFSHQPSAASGHTHTQSVTVSVTPQYTDRRTVCIV